MYIKIENIVYDISDYIDFHPGGKLILLPLISYDKDNINDATREWKLYHPKRVEKILLKLPKIYDNNNLDNSIISRVKLYLEKVIKF